MLYFKRLIIGLVISMAMLISSFALAESRYTDELTLTVGTAWKLDVPKVLYQTNNHAVCDLLQNEDKSYSILMTKPGDTEITAYIFQDGEIYQAVYLIHIVPEQEVNSSGSGGTVYYGSANHAGTQQRGVSVQQHAEEVLRLVNIERAKVGVRPLRLSPELQRATEIRAQELVQLFDHQRPNGKKCFSVLRNTNAYLGENIAAGRDTPAGVVDQWMNSPGHRGNILNGRYRELGVGYYYASGNDSQGYRHYWVQMFRG